MSEKRFTATDRFRQFGLWCFDEEQDKYLDATSMVLMLNEQQEFIEELKVSDEMGWKRAKHFEKKCPKELHNKKMYIKRLEYKVQKFKEENEQLKHYKLYEDNKRLQTIIADLKEENEQLKIANAKEIAVKNDMQYQICRKEKEDFQDMCEQLRQELKKLKLLNESLGLFMNE